MADETPQENEDKSSKFMRKVRKAKRGTLLTAWARRSGKSTVMRGSIKAYFKKERKMKTQLINGAKIKQGKLIKALTQVVLLDDYTDKLVKLIRRKRPDVLIVGIGTPGFIQGDELQEDQCTHLAFE